MIDLQVKTGLIALVCVAALGFINICRLYRCIMRDKEFAKGFRARFIGYMNSQCRDWQAYDWLITNSPRMQSEIGGHGLTHTYHVPYKQVVYSTSPIILEAIPEIRRVARSSTLKGLRNIHAHKVTDELMRHLGSLDEAARACRGEMLNPFVWLREGTRCTAARI